MFAALNRQIRRLPWYGRAVAWPFYGALWTVCSIFGWAFKEMGGSAKKGAKKIFAPLLWPAFGIVALLLVYYMAGPQAAGALLQLGLTLLLMGWGLKILIFGIKKPKKEEKKHR